MTKRKGIVSKVVLVLVVLTLISGCFVGTTLARYASQGSGSATTSVANWRVSITGDAVSSDSASMAFSDLSPSDEAWSSGATRKHSTGKKLVATIVNAGEVDATVTVSVDTTVDNVKVYGLTDSSNDASTSEVSFVDSSYDKATVLSLFSVALYYGTSDGAANATNSITSGTALTTLAPSNTYYIYAEVTWTTADSGEDDGTAGDALDTWVGNNVGSIVYNLSYTAVQASEVPADAGA